MSCLKTKIIQDIILKPRNSWKCHFNVNTFNLPWYFSVFQFSILLCRILDLQNLPGLIKYLWLSNKLQTSINIGWAQNHGLSGVKKFFWIDQIPAQAKWTVLHSVFKKDYFPNLLESIVLHQIFVFCVRCLKFWLLAYSLILLNCAKFQQDWTTLISEIL